MKRVVQFACIGFTLFGLIQMLSPQLQAQGRFGNTGSQTRDGVCFYTDEDYRGESYCAAAGESRRNVEGRFNDRFSSVRVFGRSEVVVFENEGFSGARTSFTSDVPNLRNWNDRITSFQVTVGRQSGGPYDDRRSDRGYGQYDDRNRGYQPRSGVCFYTDENYRGERFCAESGESRRNVEERFNDRFSSVRVFGGAEVIVFEDENFSGSRTVFTHDVPNLTSWNDRITSFEFVRGRGGQFGGSQPDRQYGGFGGGSQPRNGACFFTDEDYRGDSFCLSAGDRLRNVEGRFNDRISSIRVFGRPQVVIYEDENFSGASRTANRDIPNLGNFNDRLTSVEIR